MKKPILLAVLLITILLLAACSRASVPTETGASLDIIHLQISPELQHWLPRIAVCAGNIPDFGITTEVIPDSDFNLNQADLILRLGDRRDSDRHVAVLGTEEIVVIASEDLNVSSLSSEVLQGIFNGRITDWNVIENFSGGDAETEHPITVLSYPDENTVRQLFEETYLDGQAVTSSAVTFSTTDFMTDYFEDNPNAIGYLLMSQRPENVKTIEITGLEQVFEYVLAVTQEDPKGHLLEMLLCVQN